MPRGRKKTKDGVTLNLYVERSAVERPNVNAEQQPAENVETLRIIYQVTQGEYEAIMATCSAMDTKGGVIFGLAGALMIGLLFASTSTSSTAAEASWGMTLALIGAYLFAGASFLTAVLTLWTKPYRSHSTKNISSPEYYVTPIAGALAHFNEEIADAMNAAIDAVDEEETETEEVEEEEESE